ncbi:MAG: hypothetical protein M1393_08365 [Candidatus Thermoplasmatota archaeon]|nr:hypothetical protein [Candidatus Thermoplasmatota archaeon]
MNENEWTRTEKKIARSAFDNALQRECDFIIKRLGEMVSRALKISDILEMHHYLSDTLKEMELKYDYRYSRIIQVFGRLLAEGWLSEEDLKGLGKEKMEQITNTASSIRSLVIDDEPAEKDAVHHEDGRGSRGDGSSPTKLSTKEKGRTPEDLTKMIEDAIVDAYTFEEQETAFLTVLQDSFHFPFHAIVVGEPVEVRNFDLDEGEVGIVAVCRRLGKNYRVNVTALEWDDHKPSGAEWIDAYRQWRKSGL